MIDNEYSQEYQYYKGQYCRYNGTLYRARNDISVGTPFNLDNWEYRQIGLDLYQINTDLDNLSKLLAGIINNNDSITLSPKSGSHLIIMYIVVLYLITGALILR